MTRTFNIGGIWFVLHSDASGAMTGLEEHDWHEGGGISKPNDSTWEAYFVVRAIDRAHGEKFKAFVETKARAFLQSNATKYDIYADPDLKTFREENSR